MTESKRKPAASAQLETKAAIGYEDSEASLDYLTMASAAQERKALFAKKVMPSLRVLVDNTQQFGLNTSLEFSFEVTEDRQPVDVFVDSQTNIVTKLVVPRSDVGFAKPLATAQLMEHGRFVLSRGAYRVRADKTGRLRTDSLRVRVVVGDVDSADMELFKTSVLRFRDGLRALREAETRVWQRQQREMADRGLACLNQAAPMGSHDLFQHANLSAGVAASADS
jgi:hypothetical protein